jgi:hypothetical protein
MKVIAGDHEINFGQQPGYKAIIFAPVCKIPEFTIFFDCYPGFTIVLFDVDCSVINFAEWRKIFGCKVCWLKLIAYSSGQFAF